MDLKAWRTKLKLTQDDAARVLGVTSRTYQRWERGEAKPAAPGAVMLEKKTGVRVSAWF